MFRNRIYKASRARSGQSTVEYIVLATAVIATIIFFVAPGKDGKSTFQNKMVNILNETTESFVDRSAVLANSHEDTVQVVETQRPFDVVGTNSLLDKN